MKFMWIILGMIAVVSAMFSIARMISGKDAEGLRFVSLSFTALTICDLYWESAKRVTKGDWGGLEDIMPSLSTVLWIGVILLITVNGISLFVKKR